MIMIENNDKMNCAQIESWWPAKQKGFTMCPPESGSKYTVTVKPGECRIIVVQNEVAQSHCEG